MAMIFITGVPETGWSPPTFLPQSQVQNLPATFSPSNSYARDDEKFDLNQALPQVEFPDFDGSTPKLWIRNYESYFDIYTVPEHLKVKIASTHFTDNAKFWAQSLEFSVQELNWSNICKLISERFERDQHDQLLRQFFHIRQLDSVADFIEKFDSLVHQILAHDLKFNAATITNRFIDGLRDDIKVVVLVQRPGNLDTACSVALLQEETIKDAPRREVKRNDAGNSFRYSRRNAGNSFTPTTSNKTSDTTTGFVKIGNDSGRGSHPEDKAATLMNYRKAKGLCYKCGMKWSPTHKCSNFVPLHVVEEL
jgi:hypothetical protein